MLYILSSDSTIPSKGLSDISRKNEDNIEWLMHNLPQDNGTQIVMVGGKSQVSFRLRVTQAHIRHDLSPSYWSHVMLVGKVEKNLASSLVYEISLEPSEGFGFPPPT